MKRWSDYIGWYRLRPSWRDRMFFAAWWRYHRTGWRNAWDDYGDEMGAAVYLGFAFGVVWFLGWQWLWS